MENKSIWEERIKNETLWLWIALGIAGAAIIGTLAAIPFISYPSGDNETVKIHIEITKLFGTALIAALTFSTVVWRGLVGARQANEQKRANDAKDEENIAKLLLDGAKLLDEEEKATHLAAGLAALELVVTSRHKALGLPAMNILADFIKASLPDSSKQDMVDAAKDTMRNGCLTGYRSTRRLEYKSPYPIQDLIPFWGFKSLDYVDGNYDVACEQLDTGGTLSFIRVTFADLDQLEVDRQYKICEFNGCTFRVIRRFGLVQNSFFGCDMSGTAIDRLPQHRYEELRLSNCFYYRDSPPTGDGAHLILPYLEARNLPTT